jgi:hypothetical protein
MWCATGSDLRDDYNRLSVEVLFSDAELGLTFTDIAMVQLDKEWSRRTVRHAQRAYELLLMGRATFPMSEAEAATLDSRLALLSQRLIELVMRQ